MTGANKQINQIAQESGEITSKMNRTTQYFAISLIILLVLIVLELIILNIKRKKEVNRLSEKIIQIESELGTKVQEIRKSFEQKLIDAQSKNLTEFSEIKAQNEKQIENTKVLINLKVDEIKLMVDGFVQKFENDLTEKIATIETKTDKTHVTLAKNISDIKKIFDDETLKNRKEIEKLTEKINSQNL